MYHLEMRQFPHNFSRFNLTDADLRPIVEPWVREKVVVVGERKWSPHQARLTILEGPELSLQELTMGRGWRTALREGEDVTERVLGAATQAAERAVAQAAERASSQAAERAAARAAETASSVGAARPAGAAAPLGDPLGVGVQIASLLGADPTRLLEAWRAAAASSPGLTPSEALALAEHTLDTPAGNDG
jgi:hypothetical protein